VREATRNSKRESRKREEQRETRIADRESKFKMGSAVLDLSVFCFAIRRLSSGAVAEGSRSLRFRVIIRAGGKYESSQSVVQWAVDKTS
jgi:hypothetical protein